MGCCNRGGVESDLGAIWIYPKHLPHSPNYRTLPSNDEHIIVGQTPLKKVGAEDSAQVTPLQLNHHLPLRGGMQVGYVPKQLLPPHLFHQLFEALLRWWRTKPVEHQLLGVLLWKMPSIKAPSITKCLKDVAGFDQTNSIQNPVHVAVDDVLILEQIKQTIYKRRRLRNGHCRQNCLVEDLSVQKGNFLTDFTMFRRPKENSALV